MVEKKEKQYLSDNARLMAEWNWEKNNEECLTPETITLGSGKKVWWKCNNGHEWQAMIANRNRGRGCPHCSGKKVLLGYNDLATLNSSLANEWNYEKNGDLGPENFTANSGKKVWWKCSKGHEWQAVIYSRKSGHSCPYCFNQKILKGYNDLGTLNPALAKEWNHEKNGDLKPEYVSVGSNKKVWWKCNKGHEWLAIIGDRNNGHSCPYCSNQKTLKGYNDLGTLNPALAKEWNYERNGDLKPEDVTVGSNKKVWWKCSKGHEWQSIINNRHKGIGCPVCNAERNTSFPEYVFLYYLKQCGLEVEHGYKGKGYELDIYIPSKKIAIEYDGYFYHKSKTKKDLVKNHKCKNDGIKLYRIREGLPLLNDSSIDFTIDKNQKGLGIITQKILSEIVGFIIDIDLNRDAIAIDNLREYTEKENSILNTNPTLTSEWNYEKNGNSRPEHFMANSGKKVWWKCYEGHEWQARIASRNNGTGCPICSNKQVLTGYNDLATINPKLASEWNFEKNSGLKPGDVTMGSNKKVWWKCNKGHEWQATIANRNNGNGCVYCTGQMVLKGYNDLQTINPLLAIEWNYDKNGNLKPEDFTAGSGVKIWWKCKKGHEWQARINSRNAGQGCPYCASRYVIKGESDLVTLNPELASEWNYDKNGDLRPEDFTAKSGIKVWWKCSKGHEWQANIYNRNRGRGCPYCAGKYVIKGKNDLTTINPQLASEWNFEKNSNLKPGDVTVGSNKKVWWKCNKGHEWQATIANRNNGKGCPECAKQKRTKS